MMQYAMLVLLCQIILEIYLTKSLQSSLFFTNQIILSLNQVLYAAMVHRHGLNSVNDNYP